MLGTSAALLQGFAVRVIQHGLMESGEFYLISSLRSSLGCLNSRGQRALRYADLFPASLV